MCKRKYNHHHKMKQPVLYHQKSFKSAAKIQCLNVYPGAKNFDLGILIQIFFYIQPSKDYSYRFHIIC